MPVAIKWKFINNWEIPRKVYVIALSMANKIMPLRVTLLTGTYPQERTTLDRER